MSGDDLVEKVRYEADITDLTNKLDTIERKNDSLATNSEKSTSRVSSAFASMGPGLKTAALWFTGIGAGAMILVPKLLDQGAALEALDAKAKVVFSGQSLATVQSWASKVSASFGLTNSEAVAMASSMGDLFKPMGFTADEAANMSTKLGDLSGALSAWTGGSRSAAEVSEILTKAMLGERDGLKELGISISEADVQARLAKNGAADFTGQALEQAKAIATQQLIMEKSTDAQRAWTDGSMDAVKQQNAARASTARLGETFTRMLYPVLEKLLPIVEDVATWVGDKLPGALETAGKVISDVIGGGKKIIEDLANAFGVSEKTIGIALGSIAAGLLVVAVAWNAGPGIIITGIALLVAGFLWAYENVEGFRKGVQIAFSLVKAYFTPLIVTVELLIGALQLLWDKSEGLRGFLAGTFSTGLAIGKEAIDGIVDVVDTAWGLMSDLWDKTEAVRSLFAGAFSSALDGAKGVFEKLSGPVSTVIDLLNDIYNVAKSAWEMAQKAMFWKDTYTEATGIADVAGGLRSPTVNTPLWGTSTRSHAGGIVPGMPGQEVWAKLLPGERVSTESEQRSGRYGSDGGLTVQGDFHVHTTEDPRRWMDEGMWRVAF